MKTLNKLSIIVTAVIIAYSCNNDNRNKYQKVRPDFKYHEKGAYLIKDTYDSMNRLVNQKSFNRDTIPDGVEIDYYPNGNIEKWKWFIPTRKYSNCIVYYHPNGAFDTIMGRPFIKTSHNHKHEVLVEVINPPNMNVDVGYADFYNNKLIKKVAYIPITTDTTAWVILDEHKPIKGHKYMLYYYVLDSQRYLLSNSSAELYNTANGEYKEPPNSPKDSFVTFDPPVR